MDRPLIYPDELPMVEDILGMAKAALYAVGALSAATIGAVSTGVSGLPISATGPASMSVIIGTGSIYEMATVDSSAYSTLGTDANLLYKQGFLAAPATITITAPSTSGFSQNYLIQAGYADADTGAIVPPYLDSTDPLVPWDGANNAGGSQFTVRSGQLILGLKAGTAAATGSQVTPAPDAGFVGLWQITVANTSTTVTSANWSRLTPDPFAAPWFPNLQSLDGRYVRITSPTTSQTSSSLGTTFFVNGATGSDTLFDGTSATVVGTTSHGPFATVQGAINSISNLQSVNPVTINIAAGTYGAVSITSSSISSWTLIGAGVSSTFISSSTGDAIFVVGSQVDVTVSGITFTSTATNGNCCHVSKCARFTCHTTCNWNIPNGGCGCYCHDGGQCFTSNNCSIGYFCGASGALCHHQCGPNGGRCQFGNSGSDQCFLVPNGSCKFNTGFAYCYQGGVSLCNATNTVFSGSLTTGSVKFHVQDNATIFTNGAGINFFPGSVAGFNQNTTICYN